MIKAIISPFIYLYIFGTFIFRLLKSKWQLLLVTLNNRNKSYEQKIRDFTQSYNSQDKKYSISAKNDDSHVFRVRTKHKKKLTLQSFNQIIAIDKNNCFADVEGSTTYFDFAAACLKEGMIPAVCPELRSITVGGAISGVGVESSSFKYGLVHETVLEMDVLLPEGKVITCKPDNENSDLFFGIPNSYGSLGYVLRARVKLIKAKPFIKLTYQKFNDTPSYFNAMSEQVASRNYDFIDGAFIDNKHFVLILGNFSDNAEQLSNYANKDIFFQGIQSKEKDCLTTHDYLWRWDTDMFWTTQIGDVPSFINAYWFRKLFGKLFLRSDHLMTLRPALEKIRKFGFNKAPTHFHHEHLIQDVGVDIKDCTEFMNWYNNNINVYPIWICPVSKVSPHNFPLFPFNGLLCDIGFYGEKLSNQQDPWFYNKMIESKLLEMNAIKALYSDNKLSENQFWQMFDKNTYNDLKNKYDPYSLFPGLYEKTKH